MKRIVDACYPSTLDDAIRLFHDIQPVKFGNSVTWASTPVTLAHYQVPVDSEYMLILRVECYTTTYTPGAAGFGQFSAPPPAEAKWVYTNVVSFTGNSYPVTPALPGHILLDTDEYLFVKGGDTAALIASPAPNPDAAVRTVRTLVYGYLLGALVSDRIGSNEATYFGSSQEQTGAPIPPVPIPPAAAP
ncbi:MAG: hypothetical protein J2P41_00215 [Blastocatellia bacterium]|nr:hypothetical protein [Blastocatellia bacterium]